MTDWSLVESVGSGGISPASLAKRPCTSREVIELFSSDDGDRTQQPSRPLLLPQVKMEPISPSGMQASQLSPTSTDRDSTSNTRKTVWPRDFYVTDIVDYFQACEDVDGHQLGEIFAARFAGVAFRRSTYYDNKNRWLAASQLTKDNALEAGHSAAGLWSVFCRKVPSRRAATRVGSSD